MPRPRRGGGVVHPTPPPLAPRAPLAVSRCALVALALPLACVSVASRLFQDCGVSVRTPEYKDEFADKGVRVRTLEYKDECTDKGVRVRTPEYKDEYTDKGVSVRTPKYSGDSCRANRSSELSGEMGVRVNPSSYVCTEYSVDAPLIASFDCIACILGCTSTTDGVEGVGGECLCVWLETCNGRPVPPNGPSSSESRKSNVG